MRHFWKRRRWWLLGLLLAVALLAVLPFSLFHHPVHVSQAGYDLIVEGMSRPEVESLLGGPPGDYTNGPLLALDVYGGGVLMQDGLRMEWWGDEGIIQVGFDENNTVLWKRFVEGAVIRKQHPVERLLMWLGLS